MKRICISCLTIVFLLATGIAAAQILNPKKVLEKKIADKTNKEINKKADQVVDSLFGVTKDRKNPASKDTLNKATGSQAQQDQAGATSLQAYTKFDFVPGEKVLFFDDFSQDAVGDFPALWVANAPGEINTLNIAPGKWFNLNNSEGNYFLQKRIEFPKNFIIEFDIVPKKEGGRIAAGLLLYGESKPMEMDHNAHPGTNGIMISIEKGNWNTWAYKAGQSGTMTGSSTLDPVEPEKLSHVIIWVQNRRVRIYHKQAKVMDIPTNLYEGSQFNRVCFRLSRGASCGSYISNFRITDASPDMRSKLITEGKLVSYGIYFDVNKDIVKPESYGTLKSIADVLTENPDVKVQIVGHTDADGNDAANLDLSQRRAASVKKELVKTFGIDAARLSTDGKGESQPVAANDTPSNKALNRRVEFIRQ